MSDTKTCPHCAEEIKAEAKVCKHCGRTVYEVDASGRRKLPPWQSAIIIVVAVALIVAVAVFLRDRQVKRGQERGRKNACEFIYGTEDC